MDFVNSNNQDKFVSWLFKTNAVKVCQDGKPFWYTSGTIGPYFINTHFLYGSEEKAAELLSFIDGNNDNENITALLFDKLYNNYETNNIYRNLIDILVEYDQK